MNILLSLLLLHTATAYAARIDIYEFTRESLHLDTEYQGIVIDKKITDVRRDAADNLFRGRLELSPYIDRYNNEASSYYSSTYKEEGAKLGYTQFLPLGTQLIFGFDRAWENTRSVSLARENAFTLGIVQPLWRNSFGYGERQARKAFAVEAEAMEARQTVGRNDACARATRAYVDSWTQERRLRFVNEVLGLAGELYRKGEPSFKAGQIGKLDWWGVQSEYLNLQDQKSQAEQRLQQQRLVMSRAVPIARDRELADPSDAFAKMSSSLKAPQQRAEPNDEERYLAKLVEAREHNRKSERSLSRPDLDLKLTQYISDGAIDDGTNKSQYEDKNVVISLNLLWRINDASVTSQARIAELEAERALMNSRHASRTRADRFKDYVQTLISQAEQIELERKRTEILGRITDENKRRFLQGRLEFQDFLRVKEQWFDTQNRLLDKQAAYWKNLTDFSLIENFPVPFCMEAK